MPQSLFNDVNKLVSNNFYKEAIELLANHKLSTKKVITTLQARLNSFGKDVRNGVLNQEQKRIEESRIAVAIMDFADTLAEGKPEESKNKSPIEHLIDAQIEFLKRKAVKINQANLAVKLGTAMIVLSFVVVLYIYRDYFSIQTILIFVFMLLSVAINIIILALRLKGQVESIKQNKTTLRRTTSLIS